MSQRAGSFKLHFAHTFANRLSAPGGGGGSGWCLTAGWLQVQEEGEKKEGSLTFKDKEKETVITGGSVGS